MSGDVLEFLKNFLINRDVYKQAIVDVDNGG